MMQTPEHNKQPDGKPSQNVFVRFQKGFERRFNQFRERYGALLEQSIAHRNAFVTISLAIAVGSLRDAHRSVRTHCHSCLQQHRGVVAR